MKKLFFSVKEKKSIIIILGISTLSFYSSDNSIIVVVIIYVCNKIHCGTSHPEKARGCTVTCGCFRGGGGM